MNSYLKLGDAILFVWENGKVSRSELINVYWRKFVDSVMAKCCMWDNPIFFSRNYDVPWQEKIREHNDMIQMKIDRLRSQWKYKEIKDIAKEKKSITQEVRYELNNKFRANVRNKIEHEIRKEQPEEDWYYHFVFSPLEKIYARIWTDILRYSPDYWITVNWEELFYWDKLKEFWKKVIQSHKDRMKKYIDEDEQWTFAKVKLDTSKIDWFTADVIDLLYQSPALVWIRNSKK